MTKYSFEKIVDLPFEAALDKTILTLKERGFGVLTDIDVKKTLKEKLNVEFNNYRILGACNPPSAHKALLAEEQIGLLLPCNVIVYEKHGTVTVAAIRPIRAMQMIENDELQSIASDIEEKLKQTIESL